MPRVRVIEICGGGGGGGAKQKERTKKINRGSVAARRPSTVTRTGHANGKPAVRRWARAERAVRARPTDRPTGRVALLVVVSFSATYFETSLVAVVRRQPNRGRIASNVPRQRI